MSFWNSVKAFFDSGNVPNVPDFPGAWGSRQSQDDLDEDVMLDSSDTQPLEFVEEKVTNRMLSRLSKASIETIVVAEQGAASSLSDRYLRRPVLEEEIIQSMLEPSIINWELLSHSQGNRSVYESVLGFWVQELGLTEYAQLKVEAQMDRAFASSETLPPVPLNFEWRLLFVKEFTSLVYFILIYRKYVDHKILLAFMEAYFVTLCLSVLAEMAGKTDIRQQGLVEYLKEVLES